MKSRYFRMILLASALLFLVLGCKPSDNETDECSVENEKVASNIKMYTQVWSNIMNDGKVDLFNEQNFTKDVVFHASPENIVGIANARAYYSNYLKGFSKIKFTINDIFGQGDKLVKHWTFSGRHTGTFFGIRATGKEVKIEGVTLVRMVDGKIAEEQDFFDNLEFMQQIGLIPR